MDGELIPMYAMNYRMWTPEGLMILKNICEIERRNRLRQNAIKRHRKAMHRYRSIKRLNH